jgi:hypothetical protein
MKKFQLIIVMLGIVAMAGFALFKTLTQKENGEAFTKTNPEEAGNTVEKASEETCGQA